MSYVSLEDDELIEMILERPHLITTLIERIQKQNEEESETSNRLSSIIYKQRVEIKQLKELIEEKSQKAVDTS